MENKQIFWLMGDKNHKNFIIGPSEQPPKMAYQGGIYFSSSPGAETLEESKKKWGMPDLPCKICGDYFSTNYIKETKERLIKENTCFYCDFWIGYVKSKDDPRYARIKGSHYVVEESNYLNSRWNGYGGMKFKIKFFDGRLVETNNLWHQGDIPEIFKKDLQDNAEFISL